MYQISNNEEDFEPRITPKPASKLDCFIVPSVPEVSLIFEKPLRHKNSEQMGFNTSTKIKDFVHKSNTSLPNVDGSYAAWKEQNFIEKPSVSRGKDCRTPRKVQYNENCVTQSYAQQDISRDIRQYSENNYPRERSSKNIANSQEQIAHNMIHDGSREVMYQTHADNRIYIKQKHNMKTVCNIDGSTSHLPRQPEYALHSNERELAPCSSEQPKLLPNGPISQPPIHNANTNMFTKNEFPPSPHLGYQYPYFDMNAYHFPQICSNARSTHNTDNQETVKNLLQLIGSQNEQIKSLQLQVDRLLKMQEESFKENRRCTCVSELSQQNDQLLVDSCDIIDSSSCVTVPQSQRMKKNVYQNATVKEKSKENLNECKSSNQSESVSTETQSQKTFMEQKVSIGVMTSFEFTVQNSPFTLDSEDCDKNENQRKNENLKIHNGMNLCETGESLRRYKNSFARMPSAQLENIVEDSESYLSSSQQQSSNLNASVSIKDVEKQNHVDSHRETENFKTNSPRLCDNTPLKLSQNKISAQKYSEMASKQGVKYRDVIKSPAMQKCTMDYDNRQTTPYKTNNPFNTDQHKKLPMQNHNYPMQLDSINVATDYSKRHQKDGNVVTSKRSNCIEDSLILSGGDLKVGERPPPTPEPSIHVDMHEYSSDDDSEKVKRTSKVGWTFYNNVLGQVNQILQNSCVMDDQEQSQTRPVHSNEQHDNENKAVIDTVKVATLEQLRKLGISLNENPEFKELNGTKKVPFDSSYYPRLDCQANMTHTTSAVNETNTSMHMKALALKYLSDEQLAELALQRQGSTSLKHLMLSNVQGTNMSFATMRYLERYQLLPGKSNLQTEDNKVHPDLPPKADLRLPNPKSSPAIQRFPFSQTPRTSCPSKILDISTLKQQPKLL